MIKRWLGSLILLSLCSGCASRSFDPWAIAANNQDLETAKAHIFAGGEVSRANRNGDTAIIWSARNGQLALVEHLAGEHPELLDQVNVGSGETALIAAVKNQHIDVVDLLLAKGANPRIRDHQGYMARQWAAQRGDQILLQRLKPNGQENDQAADTLVAAVYSDSLSAVVSLSPTPALVNQPNTQGETALIAVAKTGSLEIGRYLLSLAENQSRSDAQGRSPLVLAVQSGHTNLVALLLDSGVQVKGSVYRGYSLLAFAVASGDLDLIALLIRSGADVNWHTGASNHITPLMIAAQHGHLEVATLLLQNGASVDAASSSGDTALHIAANQGYPGLVDLLLANGADLATENSDGYSALMVAAQQQQWFQAERLVGAGATLTEAQQERMEKNPKVAAPLHETLGHGYLEREEYSLAAASFARSADAYQKFGKRLRRQAFYENLAVGFLAGATVFVESNQRYLSGNAYREREQNRRLASIQALGGAGSRSDYFARLPRYQAQYEQAARIRELAFQQDPYPWTELTGVEETASREAAARAKARGTLLQEVAQCLVSARGRPRDCSQPLKPLAPQSGG